MAPRGVSLIRTALNMVITYDNMHLVASSLLSIGSFLASSKAT